jgi:hypothetical protein
MQTKRVLIPERLRKVVRDFGFGRIDRPFFHEGYISRRDPPALALPLAIVADARGLSFYADITLACLLTLPADEISRGRATLFGPGSSPITRQSPRFCRSTRLLPRGHRECGRWTPCSMPCRGNGAAVGGQPEFAETKTRGVPC